MFSNIRQNIIFISVVVVVFAVAGWFLGRMTYQSNSAIDDAFSAGLRAAEQRLIARRHANFVSIGYGINKSTNIGGSIKDITVNTLTLEVNPVNVLADPLLDERIVSINTTTKFYRSVMKTMDEQKKDTEEFSKKMAEYSRQQVGNKGGVSMNTPPTPPTPFAREMVTINDLKIGQNVIVVASDYIQDKKEFTATEIQIMDQPRSRALVATSSVKLK